MSREAPIWKLFFAPRVFFARHASYFPVAWIVIFSVFYGIERNFNNVFKNAVPLDDSSFLRAIVVNIVSGAFLGVSMIWVASWVFAWVAQKFGGSISSETMRKVLAWSALPKIPTVFGFFLVIAMQGEAFFTQDRTTQLKSSPALIGAFMVLQMVFALASVVIGIVGLSEMSKMTALKAIGTYLLGAMILVVPFGLSALYFGSVFR